MAKRSIEIVEYDEEKAVLFMIKMSSVLTGDEGSARALFRQTFTYCSDGMGHNELRNWLRENGESQIPSAEVIMTMSEDDILRCP